MTYVGPMNAGESELDMVKRHVREGAEHIANQLARIARFKERDLPTEMAEALLATFEDLRRQNEDHLARAEAKLSPK